MHVLIVNRAIGTFFGGGEAFDLGIARELVGRGHHVVIVTSKPFFRSPPNQFLYPLQVIYLTTPNLRKYAYLTERLNTKISAGFYHLDNWIFERAVYQWLMRYVANHRVDVVQCCSLFRLPEWLLKSTNLSVVSWLPGPPSGHARRAIIRLIGNPRFGLFAHGSPVWTLEKEMGLKPGVEFEIIEPGIDLRQVEAGAGYRMARRRELGLGEADLLGITVARLVPVKNLDLLLRGIAEAKLRGALWHWVIVGGGLERPRLEVLAHHLGLTKEVHFLGQVKPETVHQWLEAADLFALTSRYESFSIATIEAMSHGLPVIGTQVGYLQYLICSSGAGIAVSCDDPKALAHALVQMSSQEMRSNLGNTGRAFVQQFAWPIIANKVERLYEKIVKGDRYGIHA